MAQSSQSTPTLTANIRGVNHQVNLRDYLNIRVAPFLKKAITDSLNASPEYPLQWLGEHLIHQSILYEGNPDRTNIRQNFLYKFETPATPQLNETEASEQQSAPGQPIFAHSTVDPLPLVTDNTQKNPQMPTQINGNTKVDEHQTEDTRDTEMTEMS